MAIMINENSNICIGNGAQAKETFNNGGIAIGNLTSAMGQNSIALGSSNGSVTTKTTAEGNYSIAIGAGVVASTINGLGEIKIGNSQYNSCYYDGGTG
jgi:hypothetical protein